MNNGRVAKLERQIRKQQKLNWILGIIIIGAIGFGFTQAEIAELALERLVIVDGEGNPRIVLTAADDLEGNSAAIRYFDEDMNERLRTGTESGGVVASSYFDKEGEIRMGLGLLDDTGAGISMFSKEREVMLELGYHYDLDSPPVLYLENGKVIGANQLFMHDSQNELKVVIEAEDEEGDSGIHFIDEEGFARLSMGLDANSACGISMYDESYGLRCRTFVQDEICTTEFYDTNGVERISTVISESNYAFFSINDEDEAFDILMGSVGDQVVFSVEGEEDGTLHTEIPTSEIESEEITYEK